MSKKIYYYSIYNSGVYTTEKECKEILDDYYWPVYKKFDDLDKAIEFSIYGTINSTMPTYVKKSQIPFADGIDVFTDGSTNPNGTGIGIYVPSRNIRMSKRLLTQTHQRAELLAIIEAIKIFPNNKLNIYTDSQYSLNIFTGLGLKYVQKKDIKRVNYDIVEKCVLMSSGRYQNNGIRYIYINAHSKIKTKYHEYNQIADKLAKKAAK